MATYLLSELLAIPTADGIFAEIMATLQGLGLPTTDWSVGSPERTFVKLFATALADYAGTATPTQTAGGFVDEANEAWLPYLAQELYDLPRRGGTYTQQRIVLSCIAGAGPVNVTPSEQWFRSTIGNRYVGIDPAVLPVVVPDGGSVAITVQSEHPQDSGGGYNYTDPAGTITTMETPIPGVTCANVGEDFSAVSHVGGGQGTFTLSRTVPGTPPDVHAWELHISTTGQVGTALFIWRVDAGIWSAPVAIPLGGIVDLAGGARLTFVNGPGAPSFIVNDTYVFDTPGSPITTQGIDPETMEALRARCKARWPSLSAVPTEDKYVLWSLAASEQVTRALATAGTAADGIVNIVLAGQAGPVSAAVVNAVQAYLNARAGITDRPVVASATGVAIVPDGTVTVAAGTTAAAQADAQAAWKAYVDSVGIAGTVRVKELIQAVMDAAGVIDFAGELLNGSNANVVLGAAEVAQYTSTLAVDLTWTEV